MNRKADRKADLISRIDPAVIAKTEADAAAKFEAFHKALDLEQANLLKHLGELGVKISHFYELLSMDLSRMPTAVGFAILEALDVRSASTRNISDCARVLAKVPLDAVGFDLLVDHCRLYLDTKPEETIGASMLLTAVSAHAHQHSGNDKLRQLRVRVKGTSLSSFLKYKEKKNNFVARKRKSLMRRILGYFSRP
jgi:hypothetical protein